MYRHKSLKENNVKETIEKGKKYWNFGNISLTITTAALLLQDNGSKFGNIVALSYTLKRTKKGFGSRILFCSLSCLNYTHLILFGEKKIRNLCSCKTFFRIEKWD